MTDPRVTEETEATASAHLALRRRVKRGIVSTYIHEISQRHNGVEQPVEAVGEVIEGAEEQVA